MKMILKRLLPGFLLVALFTMPAMGQTRIATIDLRKVFDNYWKRQQAEAALKDRGTELDKEYKGYVEDYNKAKDDYQKLRESSNDQSVTAEEREKRKTTADSKLLEIKTAENNLRAFETNARDQLDTQRKRMRDTILQEIRVAINAKAKAGSFSLVVDTAAETVNNTPVILFTSGENDLTDVILSQLNAGAPPPSPTDSSTNKPDAKGEDGKAAKGADKK